MRKETGKFIGEEDLTRREFIRAAGRYILLGAVAFYAGPARIKKSREICPESRKKARGEICSECGQGNYCPSAVRSR